MTNESINFRNLFLPPVSREGGEIYKGREDIRDTVHQTGEERDNYKEGKVKIRRHERDKQRCGTITIFYGSGSGSDF
jgi:hypothetical protein